MKGVHIFVLFILMEFSCALPYFSDDEIKASVCIVRGKAYESGETMEVSNPCLDCYCEPPRIVCKTIFCTPRVNCSFTIPPGACCPVYTSCPSETTEPSVEINTGEPTEENTTMNPAEDIDYNTASTSEFSTTISTTTVAPPTTAELTTTVHVTTAVEDNDAALTGKQDIMVDHLMQEIMQAELNETGEYLETTILSLINGFENGDGTKEPTEEPYEQTIEVAEVTKESITVEPTDETYKSTEVSESDSSTESAVSVDSTEEVTEEAVTTESIKEPIVVEEKETESKPTEGMLMNKMDVTKEPITTQEMESETGEELEGPTMMSETESGSSEEIEITQATTTGEETGGEPDEETDSESVEYPTTTEEPITMETTESKLSEEPITEDLATSEEPITMQSTEDEVTDQQVNEEVDVTEQSTTFLEIETETTPSIESEATEEPTTMQENDDESTEESIVVEETEVPIAIEPTEEPMTMFVTESDPTENVVTTIEEELNSDEIADENEATTEAVQTDEEIDVDPTEQSMEEVTDETEVPTEQTLKFKNNADAELNLQTTEDPNYFLPTSSEITELEEQESVVTTEITSSTESKFATELGMKSATEMENLVTTPYPDEIDENTSEMVVPSDDVSDESLTTDEESAEIPEEIETTSLPKKIEQKNVLPTDVTSDAVLNYSSTTNEEPATSTQISETAEIGNDEVMSTVQTNASADQIDTMNLEEEHSLEMNEDQMSNDTELLLESIKLMPTIKSMMDANQDHNSTKMMENTNNETDASTETDVTEVALTEINFTDTPSDEVADGSNKINDFLTETSNPFDPEGTTFSLHPNFETNKANSKYTQHKYDTFHPIRDDLFNQVNALGNSYEQNYANEQNSYTYSQEVSDQDDSKIRKNSRIHKVVLHPNDDYGKTRNLGPTARRISPKFIYIRKF